MLVLHYTGMASAASAIDRLCDPASRVSSHYVVEEDGQVWSLVPEARRAWHAGLSFWRGRTGLNHWSIGIEIVNPGHEWGYRPFPAAQMNAVRDLCLGLLARHPIPARNVVGHSDIAPTRKQDPGELFDWAALARSGVGLWPDIAAPAAAPDALARIGYDPAADPAANQRAFDLHWGSARLAAVAAACAEVPMPLAIGPEFQDAAGSGVGSQRTPS